jgi:hypothetical protein
MGEHVLMFLCIHNTNSVLDIQSTDGTTGDKFQDQPTGPWGLVYRLITNLQTSFMEWSISYSCTQTNYNASSSNSAQFYYSKLHLRGAEVAQLV